METCFFVATCKNTLNLTESNTVKANAMVQIAINKAMKIDAPKYNKQKFEDAAQYALTLTENQS